MKTFDYIRIADPREIPPPHDRIIDVVVLDMNHGWPNIGHHALVDDVQELSSKIFEELPEIPPLMVRVLSFDVRKGQVVPKFERERFRLFLGTGGPGHIDPHLNDGVAAYAQGVRENPAWEKPLYSLFESILASPDVSLLAVCHTFGVLCRWSGIAEPVLRGEEKGGKSSGLVPNVLSEEASRHPWFSRFAAALPSREFRVIDNRLFDLIPRRKLPAGVLALSWETGANLNGSRSLTMVEMARDPGGEMPRILAVNHHPEIIDRLHLMKVLDQKLARGEVSGVWYRERAETLSVQFDSQEAEQSVALTSEYTLLGPLAFQLRRLVTERLPVNAG